MKKVIILLSTAIVLVSCSRKTVVQGTPPPQQPNPQQGGQVVVGKTTTITVIDAYHPYGTGLLQNAPVVNPTWDCWTVMEDAVDAAGNYIQVPKRVCNAPSGQEVALHVQIATPSGLKDVVAKWDMFAYHGSGWLIEATYAKGTSTLLRPFPAVVGIHYRNGEYFITKY